MTSLIEKNSADRICLVIEKFDGFNQFELSVEEGDIVTVINSKRNDLWYIMNAHGQKGFVPAKCLNEMSSQIKRNNMQKLNNIPANNSLKVINQNINNEKEKHFFEFLKQKLDNQHKINELETEFIAEESFEIEEVEIESYEPKSDEIENIQEIIAAELNKLKIEKKPEIKKTKKEVGLFDIAEDDDDYESEEEEENENEGGINLFSGDGLNDFSVDREDYDDFENSFTCDICTEVFAMSASASVGCEHRSCRACMSQHIRARIADRQLNDFTCPLPECDRVADQNTAGLVLDDRDWRRLNELQLRSLENVPEIVNCPQTDCGKLVQLMPGNSSLANCVCGFVFCPNCNQPYHGLLDCDSTEEERRLRVLQFVREEREAEQARAEQAAAEGERQRLAAEAEQRRLREEEERRRMAEERARLEQERAARARQRQLENTDSETFIRGNAKKCPRCRANIEKNGGCDNMSCRCGHYFQWSTVGYN